MPCFGSQTSHSLFTGNLHVLASDVIMHNFCIITSLGITCKLFNILIKKWFSCKINILNYLFDLLFLAKYEIQITIFKHFYRRDYQVTSLCIRSIHLYLYARITNARLYFFKLVLFHVKQLQFSKLDQSIRFIFKHFLH